MTAGPDPGGWRREEIRHPRRGLRVPWLALAGAAATAVAATVLVAGIGDALAGPDRSAGRLLPLQAASPPATKTPSPPPSSPPAAPTPAPSSSPPSSSPPQYRVPPGLLIDEALVRLRASVDQGVAAGDVRDDVGRDLANVIDGMLDRRHSPLDRRRADVAALQRKISTRAREGAITAARAAGLHRILADARD
ncbi:hypothetical protein HUT06_08295 [Actinomadura sp. NAK00032]|uniref:hypothetical protein n=1 Tax=Actinomadura sp. NAK00032 TaxID=2742128 RepID=UPI0015900B42|nr:hypothetical protein [Actinomadura sp. NAK00032]QKW34027.1 hypothetical protein HUT06_08295 [Actinomadura sp. NAK00032]